jgi:AcrR family transcriptional regulator
MTPQQRRDEIIAATLPLLAESGANVTTSQIARAAGIAEGTIFRVFPDKQSLLIAALGAAMSADAEVDRIGRIPRGVPLVERLLAALAAMSDYQDRLWRYMRVWQDLGLRPDRDKHADAGPRRQLQRIGAAIAALFEPDAASLRLEPAAAARMLIGLAFTNRMHEEGMGGPAVTAEQIVDLFLHGALRRPDAGPPEPRNARGEDA